ncbi:MAG: leucine--tRNA ligase [Planctomycetota bacterium]|jgi:leucyl-tRNA synthetase|nr:leucine--tRNA ligase [Planctomycetota bacterium]MDP6762043.1 leucine--tRNA ligase [Planctomycetota bacterium]MDP6989073.1 leucine--tRNA ligase [Planctomycetota bacterium]
MPAENRYEPHTIESRWQTVWTERGTFRASNPGDDDFDPAREKFYVLDMFPYPSGSGLHVGHALGYVATDAIARRKRMQGCNVLHPMGWDAFGLPAEQYAIQTGKHPAETTAENTANYRAQLERIGMAYDWSREIDTSSPDYYRWTQRLFGVLFEAGLAYQAEVPVWWCEQLKTVLANEEVINGRSERGNHPCERRPLKQWMLRITEFADRLLADLEGIDWPESIKIQQREWIGRSEGAEVDFAVEGLEGEALRVFTTRPDTLFGATFMVVAPEHPLLERLVSDEQREAVDEYVRSAAAKSDLERTDLALEKSGVSTGASALNPLLDADDPRARLPIWVADYVLMGYGTGAIMAVPGHDERDFEFAQRFGLEVAEVVRPPQGTAGVGEGACFSGEGTAVNSGPLDGLETPEAVARAVELLVEGGTGRARVTYRLRDWLFSRQRYWGEPFPLLHHADGSVTLLPAEDLPLELPVMEDFAPSADGSAPLARDPAWVEAIDPRTGEPARRDTDTMPGWAGSCWYWLRFMDPRNDREPFSSEAEAYWGPVDLYVGGAAHAVMHLLYARFWHKVFHDAGLVSTSEPFAALFNQGMIQAFAYQDATERLVATAEVEARGGRFFRAGTDEELTQIVTKMAKSLGNVVNPDDIIAEYGADTFRLYEMFMGPLADSKPWNPRDIPGCRRFLDRAWRMLVDPEDPAPVRRELLTDVEAPLEGDALFLERELNRALARIDDSYERFNLNTGIAALMSFVNEAGKRAGALTRSQAERFLAALAPLAPHFCEELWSRLGHDELIAHAAWPAVDAAELEAETYELVVQVNGKLRGRTQVSQLAEAGALEEQAAAIVAAQLEGKRLLKAVVVPGRLVNFVVR